MRLLVDIGNTSMKWRLRDSSGGCLQGGCSHDRDWSGVVDELVRVAERSPSAIDVASVAGREGDRLLGERLVEHFDVAPRFHYSERDACGVRNAYEQPGRLGVDRWLGILEAWNRYGPSVVIDGGSALTVDGVDRGRHLGGYIVPGLAMLRRSLLQNTADVHLSGPGESAVRPGCNTTEGVEHGILLMTVAFITEAVVELRRGLPDTCSVLLSGGDACVLQPWLDDSVIAAPDLILDGLERRAEMDQQRRDD